MKYNKKTENLNAYMLQPTYGYKYRLDIGEWELPVHPSIIEQLQTFHDVCRYGAVNDNFKQLIREIQKYNSINDNDNVLLTNGSDNALRLILELFATPDSKLLVPVPSYTHFESMLKVCNLKQLDKPYMNYKWTNQELHNFLVDELKKDYDLCYIVNPSMPIGHLFNHTDIQTLLTLYPNTLFILDEAYLEFSTEQSCAPLIEQNNNLIVVKTFSKFFSLASLRIGYLMTNPTIISLLKPLYNYKDITQISVKCALKTLLHNDFYNENKKHFFETKKYIIEQLTQFVKNNSKITDFIMNDGVYFTLICKDPSELKIFFDEHSIAVRNKDCDIKGALRITVGTCESMEKVIEVLKLYE
jgi:histidinol-phosphate aminotransferase